MAQVDLARAQGSQATARLEELRINLSNTRILSPVDGFVGSRSLDPGAFVGTNSSFLSVVDIHFVRLVANLVEKDLRRIVIDMPAVVEVDAYPGETFAGRVARLAPVLDPGHAHGADGGRGAERRRAAEARACTRACSSSSPSARAR